MSDVFKQDLSFPKLLKFALPNIIMMVFLSLYVIIDGIFISSKVGDVALGGVNIVYPVISLMFALSIMIGCGGGALISKKLGEGKIEEARKNFSTLIIIEIFVSLIFLILGNVFIEQIVKLLGGSLATQDLIDYGVKYLRVALCFAPALFLQCAFQTFFITAGKPLIGMVVVICAGITNIIMDYLLIVVFQMGVEGAGFATALGQCIPAVVGILYFSINRSNNLYLVKPDFDFKMITKACTNGSSECLSNLSNAVTTFLFNVVFLSIYGENGAAAITIILYFQFIIIAIFFGYTNGISPVISYKYGEGKMDHIKKILKQSIVFIFFLSITMFVLSLIIGGPIISAFVNKGTETYDIAFNGLKYFVPSFLFIGFSILASAFFTALNDGLTSGIISACRTLIFLSLSIIICSAIFGGNGAFSSVAVAEFLGLAVSIFFLIYKKKRYNY